MTDGPAEGKGPQVYSIAAHRGFADALVAGLLPRYGDDHFGLARLTLLLPSQRAIRTVTEAFVRLFGQQDRQGLLLPRMAAVGDLDIDETLGPLLDPLGTGADIPPAIDPTQRWLRLARILDEELGDKAPKGSALLRQAFEIGRTMDRLLVEGIGPEELIGDRVLQVVGDLAAHWQQSILVFARVQAKWLSELKSSGQVDAPARRNMLFDQAARRWASNPPPTPIVAAGITSASPSLARLLKVVSLLPKGAVILPDLDLSLDDATWTALGTAGVGQGPDDPPFARDDAVTHPQYHLKLLLNRMGINRQEVQPWHRAGMAAAPPERSKAISNLFLPPAASARWVDLAPDQRRLAGVRMMISDHPGHEAQAIALKIREALEVQEKRIALITPDRALAARVISHLGRWGIVADDTAGEPLPLTPAGRLMLQLAEVAATNAAPVPLLALLGHPYAGTAFGRPAWLDFTRALDLALRGPRRGPGLEPLREICAERERHQKGMASWWDAVESIIAPLIAAAEGGSLATTLDALVGAAEAISGAQVWSDADGRCLAGFVEDLRSAARHSATRLEREDLATALRDAMERVSVRKPWGGHPRVAVYGLIEARMSRADLVICGGLTEGTWPASPSPDALLAPPILRALGVPGADFRIGLSAHDLAAALGAPEVVLSYAKRDSAGPAIPSRFVLRVRAMLGADLLERHLDRYTPELARRLTQPASIPAHPRPHPKPSAEQRDVPIAVTGLDRLRGDPYQFYASDILRLRSLDALDAEPTAAWKGTAVHAILERWHKEGGALSAIAAQELEKMSAHPLVRGLWWPRLIAGLQWIEQQIEDQGGEGRSVLKSEVKGEMTFAGVKIKGRADRIDRLADGSLAVIDYKTGSAPSARRVENGFALQLGLIGLMARDGAFAGVAGEPTHFEYWSLKKNSKSDTGFGEVSEPIPGGQRKAGIPRDEFLDRTEEFLADAIKRWIKGDDPFTARLNPDVPGYADYDQLMRLDEWQGREEKGA